jgi:FtsP/CotA-like multicopper oxidase with cupredoxin domain
MAVVLSALAATSVVAGPTCLANPQELTFRRGGNGVLTADIDFTVLSAAIDDPDRTTITTRTHVSSVKPDLTAFESPTIRMKRGTKYQVNLYNKLEPSPDCGATPCVMNTIHKLNITNIHTHGLHISGAKYGDDVRRPVDGGKSSSYTWNLPCDHAGGMQWYHPHNHGSTTVQVGGLAAGALIVEDDIIADGLPQWWDNPTVMDSEQIMIMQHLEGNYISTLAAKGGDKLFAFSGPDSLMLINSQYNPTLCLTEGKWKKWRMLNVDTRQGGTYRIKAKAGTTGTCKIELLAKDGVMVSPAPRSVAGIYLSISARVDALIHCPAGEYELVNDDLGVVAQIVSTAGTSKKPYELESFKPTRPEYLRDTLDEVVPAENKQYVDTAGDSVKSIPWSESNPPLFTLKTGTVSEWQVGIGFHPLHMHVHHFQLVDMPDVSGVPGWTQKGDWLDLLDSDGVVRFRAERFGGPIMLHCHVLEHEDMGAMAMIYSYGGCDALGENLDDGGAACDMTCKNVKANVNVPENQFAGRWEYYAMIGLLTVGFILLTTAGVGYYLVKKAEKKELAANEKAVPLVQANTVGGTSPTAPTAPVEAAI